MYNICLFLYILFIGDDNYMMDIEEEVLNLIKKNSNGITQNLIWKELNIDSRKCSRIIKKLMDLNLIIREDAFSGGSKTYLIKYNNKNKNNNFSLLMANDMFSPCTGCNESCMPEYCQQLTKWIINLSDSPSKYDGCFGDYNY